MVNILGINAFHGDSSACLLKSGQIVAAAEEERFRRIKHYAGFPTESIKYCLEEAKINITDIEHLAINTNPFSHFSKKIIYTIKNRINFSSIIDQIKIKRSRLNVVNEIKKIFPKKKFFANIHYIEHHLAHLASSHLISSYENSIAISLDGFGDFSSTAWGIGHKNNIKIDGRIFFPHSLGIFYQALTQFLGFTNYGDEYKVMGLAPYGKPSFINCMRNIIKIKKDGTYLLNLELFRHHNEKITFQWKEGMPIVGLLFNKNLEKLLKISARKEQDPLQQVHYDIAHCTQVIYEEVFFNLLRACHAKYKIDNLTLSGGCAMNSVANGKIFRHTPYKKLYIQAAAGDAGGAIGGACVVAAKLGLLKTRLDTFNIYLGPSFTNDYHRSLIKKNEKNIASLGCTINYIENEDKLCDEIAKDISHGLVVGWFQGRMEWGPRALGNRSILADPRRKNMKDILNLKIKRRESFRPFAPSILRQDVSDWFEEENDVPFMSQVFQIKKNKRSYIPAVTHIDGSGRLQTVHSTVNPIYFKLISAFKKITGIPIILNTSFNENEPIVCIPEEALATFLRTKMDLLVLGNWIVRRNN